MHIRDVPDFPKPGILFRDITPLLSTPAALAHAIDRLAEHASALGADSVLAPEARGFMLGGAVAARAGAGFVPARKPGRLPRETISVDYELEYAADVLQVHRDAMAARSNVLVLDDLLATGGTAEALCTLVERSGARVAGCAFAIELSFLGGRARLAPHGVHSLVSYDSG